jgi:hypothetical protein
MKKTISPIIYVSPVVGCRKTLMRWSGLGRRAVAVDRRAA